MERNIGCADRLAACRFLVRSHVGLGRPVSLSISIIVDPIMLLAKIRKQEVGNMTGSNVISNQDRNKKIYTCAQAII